MKLSTKGRYGLRAMVDIAVYSQDSPVPDQCDRRETEYFSQILRAIITQTEESGDHQKYSWSTGWIYVR